MTFSVKVIDEGLEAWIKRLCERWQISGLSLALTRVSEGERHEETFVYGKRDSLGQPMETSTRLCLASNSKLFTAVAIGILIHEKTPLASGRVLGWDTKLKDIFQEDWQMMDKYMELHADVLDLLSMRTGMASHDSADLRDPPPLHYLHILPHLQPSAELRRAWQYNNMNYFIAAYLVERVSGTSFPQFMQTCLLGPLGMSSSSYDADEVKRTGQRAEGFTHVGIEDDIAREAWKRANGEGQEPLEAGGGSNTGPVESQAPPECVGALQAFVPYMKGNNLHDAGAGGVWTTAEDLSKWLAELVDPKIIPKPILEVIRTAHAVQSNDASPEGLLAAYGCGVEVATFRSRLAYLHGGSVPGYRSITVVVPDSKGSLGIGIICNDDMYGGEVATVIAYELMDRWLGTQQPGGWERKIFDGEFRDEDDKDGDDDTEESDQSEQPALPVDLEGSYRNPGYPSFQLSRLASDDQRWNNLDKIRTKAERHGKVDWDHAYTGTYSAEYISDILFVAKSGLDFVWVTWDWTEDMERGQPTGNRWPIVYGLGKAVVSQGKNGIEGIGMFGDWWEQGEGIRDRRVIRDDVKRSAEVLFERSVE